ncbi:MAG TPA: hypothetical protein VF727_02135 [Allosphingosinicella sp.]|jgi:hypothetical protein
MRLLTLAAAALAAVPAFAQTEEAPPPPGAGEERINQLVVYGNDPCPKSTDEEITVCARKPETERFRIPKGLRDEGQPTAESWASRASELQYVGRSGIGSCSPTGPGGATGCLQGLINNAREERRQSADADWNALIAQARRERLGRIDAEAEAEEKANAPD